MHAVLIQLLLFITVFGLGSCYIFICIMTPYKDLYSARKQNYKNPAVLSTFMIVHTSFLHVSDVSLMHIVLSEVVAKNNFVVW